MSYILDALRRAESERDRGGVPNIHAQQVPMTSLGRPAGRAALAPWIVAAAALLLLAVLAWRLLGRGDAVQVASGPAAPTPSAAPAPQPSVAVAPAPGLATSPAQAPATMSTQEPAPAPAPARVAPVTPRPSTTARAPAPAPAVATRAPARAPTTTAAGTATGDVEPAAPVARRASEPARVAAGPASQGVIYNRADLPPDIQRALPNLAIGGSSFSQDSASRMLILNGQVFHEGDPLGPDLTLEQIQLKAAVFRFKGYRYRITF
jgi:general secretion pathway protein B